MAYNPSTKYATLASQVISLIGGPQNVRSAYHCQTRLRFELRDESQVDTAALADVDGVAATRSSGGTFQVVIGTHVKDVFEEVDRELRSAGVSVEAAPGADDKGAKRMRPVGVVIDFIAGTFQPIVPALSGAGMIMALLAVLVVTNVVTRESQTYVVLSFMANAVFYFLPVFVAISAADKLKTNRILAGVVAAMLLHPAWTGLVAAGDPVSLFGVIPLTLASYGSTVIPILLIVFVQSYAERWLNRVIPNAVKLVVVPMLVFLVMGTLALAVLGPIGTVMGAGLAAFFTFLTTNAPWVPPVIIGTLLPIMVMFGVHNAVAPLGFAQLAQMGYDSIFGPGAICSNIAVGVASLVVAFRTKERKMRQIATAGGITGLMGITEPSLYGVLLPKRYPLVAAMIGGGLGGLYVGITSTHRFAVGTSGLPAVFLYIGNDTLTHFVNILIALGITIVGTAIAAVALSFRFERPTDVEAGAQPEAGAEREADADAALTAERGGLVTAVRTGLTELTSPARGTIVPLAEIEDAAFSSGAMGPGVGIEPTDGAILAPVSGTVLAAMPTGHAFGILTDDGTEILVHVGIDTVQMKGDGFSGAVTQGARIVAGQRLVTADLAAIRAAGHPATIALIVTNAERIGTVKVVAHGPVLAGEPVLTVSH
ncbi:PTS beta-glucoside transporter subunit EIIBCA [Microbacterium laevaniformans]|uniref:PTS beta-glucoside transporter subunit EIIBCA n=1 Tax=Microbacterium laevaniformans TaxID=36807 RepID=A0A4S2D7U2_9MICO|nr:beta-glucoside-specific PTS transporter subunit IIABC [Microbacterium laevaniformans]TGY36921.1 PTS beta-glucoside transporter subunit EIIBCA [Microbacterium laevaniformans]